MKLIKADVEFKVKGKPIKFSVIHNLPNDFGLSFNNALDNWLERTNTFTAHSLCKYILSKQTGFVAITENQYQRISKYGNPVIK